MWQWVSWQFRHRVRVFVHRLCFPGRRMFYEAAAKDLRGKTVIVTITRLDAAGALMEEDEFYGRIDELSSEHFVIRDWAGDERRLPPDLRSLFPARQVRYRSRATGRIVTNPDLMTRWTQRARPQELERRTSRVQ